MYIYIYDRAYASSSSCDGKRACACAPKKASAADARVQKIARPRAGPEVVCLLPAAAATSDLCMCPERHQWQSQRVQGCARMQPTDLWATSECRTHRPASKAPLPCARPVPPNVSLRLAAPTERLPGGRQRHPTTSLRGPRPSTDASAAPLPTTSPAAPRPAATSPSAATATPGRVGRASDQLRARGRGGEHALPGRFGNGPDSDDGLGGAQGARSSHSAPTELPGRIAALEEAQLQPQALVALAGTLRLRTRCSPRARSWSLAARRRAPAPAAGHSRPARRAPPPRRSFSGFSESVTTISENPRGAEKPRRKWRCHALSRTRDNASQHRRGPFPGTFSVL